KANLLHKCCAGECIAAAREYAAHSRTSSAGMERERGRSAGAGGKADMVSKPAPNTDDGEAEIRDGSVGSPFAAPEGTGPAPAAEYASESSARRAHGNTAGDGEESFCACCCCGGLVWTAVAVSDLPQGATGVTLAPSSSAMGRSCSARRSAIADAKSARENA